MWQAEGSSSASTRGYAGAQRKSSRSNHGVEGDCVEVAELAELVAMGDSKDPAGPILLFTQVEWRAFLSAVRADDLG
jgi:hypothetical protein